LTPPFIVIALLWTWNSGVQSNYTLFTPRSSVYCVSVDGKLHGFIWAEHQWIMEISPLSKYHKVDEAFIWM